ncbi:grpE protein homolog 2, mitochondrial [Hyla sarda]|uniref:grpE protein homolog 2, mitochondrial n=1 Tax=Hyla sarda TaxID=327740 RepID=UPI0024C2ECEE|nr:grpE protein homolog 2, mitochondrial [Hyla sarda]
MAGLRLRAADQLRTLLSHGARNSRCSASAYSTAPQQRSTGDKTPKVESTDEKTYSVLSLEKKALKLEEQVQDLTLRYQKAVTDAETVRKRTQKFVQDAKLFGIQSFCRDLVEIADILEHAVNEAEKQGKKDLSEILSSVESKLQSIFTKNGLHKMTPMGGDYDPYDHEIVCHVPAEGRRPGSVATIQQDGYKLHGRTIRHAHVGIAVETQES